jgi:S-formylglutathione hydrolase
MGGYGALKIAFAEPARWQAVAAIAPVLLPAATPQDLLPRNTLGCSLSSAGRWPVTAPTMASSRPTASLHRLRANADAIRTSELPIRRRPVTTGRPPTGNRSGLAQLGGRRFGLISPE